MPLKDAPVATPCVKLCIVDGESGLCLGCLRSLAEIAAWGGLDAAERSRIMAGLGDRLAQIHPEKRRLAH
jgi:predicted Fe-S protein YdhL (DUF1289 family)